MAAATGVLTSSKEYSNGVKLITLTFTASSVDASFLAGAYTLTGEMGKKLHSIVVDPGGVGPTDNCNLSIVDSLHGTNVVATNGADAVDNAVTRRVLPDTAFDPCIIGGTLTINPDIAVENLVNSAVTVVTLIIQSKFN